MRQLIKSFLPDSAQKNLSQLYGKMQSVKVWLNTGFKTCLVKGKNIKVLVESEVELFRVQTYETKEPETLEWLDTELRDSDVLFDVGANIGIYSLYAAAQNARSQIYAFEPEAQNFAHLCKNIYQNHFRNITPCCIALSDCEKFDYLHVSDMKVGSAFHSIGSLGTLRTDITTTALKQGFIVTSIDKLVEDYLAPAPSLIKIDVDGLELNILQGAKNTLKSGKVRSVLVEINGDVTGGEGKQIFDIFAECGFYVSSTGLLQRTNAGIPFGNYIFKKKA